LNFTLKHLRFRTVAPPQSGPTAPKTSGPGSIPTRPRGPLPVPQHGACEQVKRINACFRRALSTIFFQPLQRRGKKRRPGLGTRHRLAADSNRSNQATQWTSLHPAVTIAFSLTSRKQHRKPRLPKSNISSASRIMANWYHFGDIWHCGKRPNGIYDGSLRSKLSRLR
jgi:hypothetical protein